MYTQQFTKSVKKFYLWYLYGRFRKKISDRSTILDKLVGTFFKIGKFGSILRHRLTSKPPLTENFKHTRKAANQQPCKNIYGKMSRDLSSLEYYKCCKTTEHF